MARSGRHLTEVAALLAERGVDLVVLKQGIDTATPAGRFLFHVIGAMDEMLGDLIREGTLEGLEAADPAVGVALEHLYGKATRRRAWMGSEDRNHLFQ